MNRLVSSLVVVLLLCACAKDTKLASSAVSFSNEKEFVYKDDIYDLEFVEMENTDASVFSVPSQVFFSDTFIVIFDDRTRKVLEFNTKGKFLGAIGRIGQAAEEYALPMSVWVSDTIVYVSDFGAKTLCYGLRGRHLIKQLPYLGWVIAQAPQGDLLAFDYLSESKQHLSVCDRADGSVKWKSLPMALESGMVRDPIYRIAQYEDDVYVYPPYDRRLFVVQADSCREYASFFFGDVDMDIEQIVERQKQGGRKADASRVTSWIPMETADFLTVRYSANKDLYLGVMDKKTQETYFWKTAKGSKEAFLFTPIGTHGDKLFRVSTVAYLRESTLLNEDKQFVGFVERNKISDESYVLVSWRIR